MNYRFKKNVFKRDVQDNCRRLFRKELDEATPQEQYQSVSYAVKEAIIDDWIDTQRQMLADDPKILYYMSMEFLMGRALGNNLINMSAYDEVREALEELNIDLNFVEDQEPDPALGNGGLGRLAACFLDSLASLGYVAYGCGIRYHYGMFKQAIDDGFQVEKPDNWLKYGNPFELRRPEYAKEIRFGGNIRVEYDDNGKTYFKQENYESVLAVPCDYPVVGYNNHHVNTLRIWDAEPIVDFQLESFDRGDYHKAVEQQNLAKTIVEVLYPNDNHMAGKELRLKQQYFYVSASLQAAVARYMKHHDDIRKLPEKAVFQMNDTHPTVAVAELMRILLDEYHLEWVDAWDVVTRSCAFTNHTIMAEALEKWPVTLFSRLLPRVYQIIQEIDRRFLLQVEIAYPGAEEKKRSMAIIHDGQVRMANMAIIASFSVNGVARLHTEILKARELKHFYQMMPEKFNNKTNGITQRRFLMHGNPRLAAWVTDKLDTDLWATDLSLMEGLKEYTDDERALEEFLDIKYKNKERLADYILAHNGIEVDPRSMFDVQVKRLHEYKRQFLNILHVMYLYNKIKEHPEMSFYPRTFIYGAKASAGYKRAKSIIKLINSVAEVINNDRSINGKIKVVFIEDYRVSNAEIIFAASDVSEQISTASKEASGTGNMKFMLNGAPTLGTLDGANVEIIEEVGEENAFIFGLTSDEVMNYEKNGGYDPKAIYDSDPELKRVVDQLIDGTYSKGDKELFKDLYDSLFSTAYGARPDQYFILKDFRPYAEAQERVEKAYIDREGWAKKALMNTACCGKFSSDRTIQEYVDEIWHLDRIRIKRRQRKNQGYNSYY